MAFLDTPRTDAGNATFLGNGNGIDDVSMEVTFISPKKRQGDLLSQIRGKTTSGLRTPSTRRALLDRPNIAKKGGVGEFTPLLKSATKNLARKGKENVQVQQTPGFLRTLHEADENGDLPVSESSIVIGSDSDNTDMALQRAAASNLPNLNSSSIMSTPMIGKGKNDRMLEDQRNLMTLREQENIINKTEKENFGLKLKIHFLEEMLAKSDPNLNQDAIRQNTDLRVDRATLQRELNKVKKQLHNSAREAETLRQQLLEDQAKSDQQAADKRLRREMDVLRQTLETRERDIESLRSQLHSENRTQEVQELKDAIEDLEADLREKQRLIDNYEDNNDARSDHLRQIKDLESELEEANEKLEELQELQSQNEQLQNAARQAREDLEDAETAKRLAQRERSSTDAELEAQMEEERLNFRNLREKYDILKDGYKSKSATIQELEVALKDSQAKAQSRESELRQEIADSRQRHQDLISSSGPAEERFQDLLRQLNAKADEKNLLQTRHDALTDESEGLQRDLSRTRSENAQLQLEVDSERQRSLDNERSVKEESKRAHEKLSAEISRLRSSLDAEKYRGDSTEDKWQTRYKDAQSQNAILETRITSLQQNIDKLQQNEGKLTTRESRIQASLDAEKERHKLDEDMLQRQIQDLQAHLNDTRSTSGQNRNELAACKEELRLRMRDLEVAVEKQEALEDEIVVLQSSVDDEGAQSKREIARLTDEIRAQRKQLSSNKIEIAQLDADRQSAELIVQSLKDDVNARSSIKNQSNSRLAELKDLVGKLQIENRSLSSSLRTAEARASQLESEAGKEQKDLSLFRNEEKDRQAKISELEDDKHLLVTQLRSAQGQIKELELQAVNSRKDQSAFRHDQDEKQDKILALQSEKRSLSTRLTEALESVEKLETQARAEVARRDTIRYGHEFSQARLEELQAQKESLGTRLSEALTRIKEYEHKIDTDHGNALLNQYGVSTTRREPSALNRETSYKIDIARLEEKVADLRDQLRNQAFHDHPPKTPFRSPLPVNLATPNEIGELRLQLDEARRQSKIYRDQIQDLDKKARKSTAGLEKVSHERNEEVWQLRRELEKKTEDLQSGQHELAKIRDAVDKSSTKLRSRIQELEKELRQTRLTQTEDDTMAMERQDLHEMVKSAKLEAEDLRLQLTEQLSQADAFHEKEKMLRTTMQRIRDERAEQQQRVTVLSSELSKLQDRYDGKVEELYQQAHRVVGSQPRDKKTTAEMKGLAKQIDWLKENLTREKSFRQALAYEKQYYLQQIDMYNACNAVDIELLKQMGCYTKAPKKPKTKSLRPVATVIIALIRMQNISANWASDQKYHKDYLKKIDQARGKKRVPSLKR